MSLLMSQSGKSGSTYIDCGVHEWMERTFGDAFTAIPVSKTSPGSAFLDSFEQIKKIFDGKDMKKQYPIHLPALGKILKEKGRSPTSYDFEEFNVLISGYANSG